MKRTIIGESGLEVCACLHVTVHMYVCLYVCTYLCVHVCLYSPVCISVHVWNAAGQGSPSTGMRWGHSLLKCCG